MTEPSAPEVRGTQASYTRALLIILLFFAVAGAAIILLDRGQIRQAFQHADWPLLIPALLLAAVSYLCLSIEVALIFRVFGAPLPTARLLEIGFVSYAVTYTLNVGGVTGLSLQFAAFKKSGLRTEDILAPSLFQFYLASLPLVPLLLLSLGYILAGHVFRSGTAYATVTAALTSLLVLAGLIILIAPVRHKAIWQLQNISRLLHIKPAGSGLARFDAALSHGISLMRRRPAALAGVLLLTLIDWSSTVAALWLCFRSLGAAPGLLQTVTGFSLGITAGFISFIPGGLGVQEASMAGVFGLLGTPFSVAALAAVLFRVIYYFVPFTASLFFYRRLFSAT
jgi:uncharacterized protein (TIRG00374 family)